MCGLLGMAGPGLIMQDVKILKDLGTVSMLRGTDGAGVFQVRSHNKHYSQEEGYKTWGNWVDLLDELDRRKNNRLIQSVSVDTVMCHVRSATKGGLSDANSHPFAFTNIVGAHNGTLKDKRYDHASKTDSELMFADINNRGMEEVLTELDKDSAFAVSVFDRKRQVLRFARNELRPLAFAFLKDRGVMYWASEKDMLKYVLYRRGEEAVYFNLRPNKIVSIDPEHITKKNIEEGPLVKIIKCDAELDRPLPTTFQQIEDAKKKREADEAEKQKLAHFKNEEGTKVTTQQMSNVVPFVPNKEDKETKKDGSTTTFLVTSQYKKCSCGSETLDLLAQSLAKRGKHLRLTHNPDDNTFRCKECPADENVQTG